MVQLYRMDCYFPDPASPGGYRCDKRTFKAGDDVHAISEAERVAIGAKPAHFEVRHVTDGRRMIYNSRREKA